MSVLNPDHLFEQADKLIAAPAAGPPRQVDLRRAASGAYYALFHFVAISLGDEFVGVTQRSTARYSVVYRSVDHRALRELCSSVTKVTPPQKLARYLPTGGFGRNIVVFANAVIDLQEQRHRADYDPSARYRTSEVATIIETGRSAQDVSKSQMKLAENLSLLFSFVRRGDTLRTTKLGCRGDFVRSYMTTA